MGEYQKPEIYYAQISNDPQQQQQPSIAYQQQQQSPYYQQPPVYFDNNSNTNTTSTYVYAPQCEQPLVMNKQDCHYQEERDRNNELIAYIFGIIAIFICPIICGPIGCIIAANIKNYRKRNRALIIITILTLIGITLGILVYYFFSV